MIRRFLLFVSIICSPASATLTKPVAVDGGLVSGALGTVAGVSVYKGIPFAASPVDGMRWRPPAAVVPWSGVLAATEYSPQCPQEPRIHDSVYWRIDEPISENCLYLNIWTPANSANEKLPVMIWIYGGGFVQNSGSAPAFDGNRLAGKGVVIVTFNYRLGALGFLAHPELTLESPQHVSGNYGLLDQIAVLKWVRRNIDAFGGDASKVTLFGESAGAMSIADHVASPLSKGLFIRSISQSGGFEGLGPRRTLAQAEQDGITFQKTAGATSLSELRQRTPVEIMRIQTRTPIGYSPVYDGYILPKTTTEILATGDLNPVAMMGGANSDEGDTLRLPPPSFDTQQKYATYRNLYPPGEERLATADDFLRQSRAWASAMNRRLIGTKNYVYYFDRRPPFLPDVQWMEGPGSSIGAYHAAEIIYVFDTLQTRNFLWTEADRRLAEMMSAYWTNFAKTGDPNGIGLPAWPPYSDGTQQVLILGSDIHSAEIPHRKILDTLDRLAEATR